MYYKRENNVRSGIIYWKIKNLYSSKQKKCQTSCSEASSSKGPKNSKNCPRQSTFSITNADRRGKTVETAVKNVPNQKQTSLIQQKPSFSRENLDKNNDKPMHTHESIRSPEESLKLLENQEAVLSEENIVKHWNNSCELRWSKYYHQSEAHEICEKYPSLKSSYGHKLVNKKEYY